MDLYCDSDDYCDSDSPASQCSSVEDVDLPFLEAEDNKGSRNVPQSTWKVIDEDNLEKAQRSCLASVMDILGCPVAVARTLLIHYSWDTEVLFGQYADRGPEWMLQSASVTSKIDTGSEQDDRVDGTVYCGSCLCDVPSLDSTSMACGHSFCNNCWRQYMTMKVTEGGSRHLACMAFKCGAVCLESKVKELLFEQPEVVKKYERSLLESFIEDNKKVRWCPSVPHCGNAIEVEGEPLCEPECSCGVKFCFSCGLEPHSPCTCTMWKAWSDKSRDDSETSNWMTANTKPCPKCNKPVEKSGGCNLVLCLCGQAFCWLCGAATQKAHNWTTIYGHDCGRWKEDLDRDIDVAQRQLERYNHYHSRWSAHMDSLAMEKRQGQWFRKIKEKVLLMENSDSELKDYSWLHQTLQQLLEARRVLGYSYVFAYYMFSDMFQHVISRDQNKLNQNLFEDQQQQLEGEVERLSGFVQNMDDAQMIDREFRLSVINSTVNVDIRSSKLYDLVEKDLLGPLDMPTAAIAPYRGNAASQPAGDQSTSQPECGPSCQDPPRPGDETQPHDTPMEDPVDSTGSGGGSEKTKDRGKRPMAPPSVDSLKNEAQMKRSKSTDKFRG
mmetsp:Transcript_37117/g.94848  ORF Transcript_37117/g.94848 Transcript_37117/m.94848 type:complete len:608 (-) Transcript_37117:139-1962(-)